MTEFPNAEANFKALEKLQQEPENKKCADCTATSSDGYLILDFGTFVCFHCAEVHRSLGNTAKKISTHNIRDEDIEVMKKNGNRVSYDKWLVKYTGDHPEPNGTTDRNYRVEYIRLKYQEKKWARADAVAFYVEAEDTMTQRRLERQRSASSPAPYTGPSVPFGSQNSFNSPQPFYAPPHTPPQVQLLHQQQMQQQLHINQQQLQQQQMQQQLLQQQLAQQQFALQQQYHHQQMLQQSLSPRGTQSLPTTPVLASPQMPFNLASSMGSQYAQSPPRPLSLSGSGTLPGSPFGTSAPSALAQRATSPPTTQPSPSPTQPSPAQRATSPTQSAPLVSPRGSTELVKSESLPGLGGKQRSSSKIGVCPQCGVSVDSRDMGKHKVKDCPFRANA